jgi:hypothetical protein
LYISCLAIFKPIEMSQKTLGQCSGAAVTLLAINDPDIRDHDIHDRIIARSKQLLSYEGVTHPNGTYEAGLDAARYINAFPGTAGDYRAWIGGIRDPEDIVALLENISYAYHRAKIVVLEEELAAQGTTFEKSAADAPVLGVAKVTTSILSKATADPEVLKRLRETSETLALIWGAIHSTLDPIRRAELIAAHGEELTLATNELSTSCDSLGLNGAFDSDH